MKRIILFTIFAIMIYAGGYLLYYGISDAVTFNNYPRDLRMVTADDCGEGQAVIGDIYQVVGEMKGLESTVEPAFLGIPIGKPVSQHYFLMPLGYEEDVYHQKYILICVSTDEDAAALRGLLKTYPEPRRENDPTFAFKGVIHEANHGSMQYVAEFLNGNTKELVGMEYVSTYTPLFNRIVPYVINKDYREKADYTALIVGGVLTVGGLAAALILFIKIQRERNGY